MEVMHIVGCFVGPKKQQFARRATQGRALVEEKFIVVLRCSRNAAHREVWIAIRS
jgi:hypothetical protein